LSMFPTSVAPNASRLELFGRHALIYEPPRHGDGVHDVLAVLYGGPPLREYERRALTTLVGYLCGGRAGHVLTETFNTSSKLSVHYTDRGQSTPRKSPPVPLVHFSQITYARLVYDEIPRLAARLASIYAERGADARLRMRTLDAALHHYAEGVDSAYPTTRILRIAVAFEALVNLVTHDSRPNESILSSSAFKRLRRSLLASLKQIHEHDPRSISSEQAKRLATKINQLNIGSNTARVRRFWEAIKVTRAKGDDELIRRLRNESVHMGFVGDEGTRQSILRNYRSANRLIDLFNRAFLAYLGYRGPVLTADEERWVNAKTGRAFKLPSVPQIEPQRLEITTTAPEVNHAVAATLEQLQRIRRKPRSRRRRRAP
jgi:hypothetical protein